MLTSIPDGDSPDRSIVIIAPNVRNPLSRWVDLPKPPDSHFPIVAQFSQIAFDVHWMRLWLIGPPQGDAPEQPYSTR
jgi:hypothetical protein